MDTQLRRWFAFDPRRMFLRVVMGAAGIAAVLVLLLMPRFFRSSDPMQSYRTLDARMVGFDYAPLRVTRGAATGLSDQVATYTLLSKLQARVEEERSPENLRQLARAELAADRSAKAVELLEEAHRASPADTAILTDLAAAELAVGHVADAAEHSAMALERDPSHAEAAFGWAVAMEKLSNRPAAIQAWRRYLIVDDSGPWAGEARERLAALERPRLTWAEERKALVAGADAETIRRLVAKYPYHARLRILNILFPNWAKTADPRVFALMRAMAAEKASSDPYLLDAVDHAGRSRDSVAPAVFAFRAGLDAVDSGDFDGATARFSEAARISESAGSPLWIVSMIYAATTESYAGNATGALARITDLERRLNALEGRYPSMLCDAVWLRGLLQARAGFPALALEAFREAAEAARRAGEIEQEAAARQLIAATLEITGDPHEAEQARIATLRASDAISADRDRMFGAYADAAYAVLKSGRPRVARAFAYAQMYVAEQEYEAIVGAADPANREQAFANARDIRDRWGADSDVRRALALLDIGRADVASHAIGSARARAVAIGSPGYRDRVLAEVDFAAGLIEQRRGDPRAAIAAFSSAIAIWERQEWRLHAASGYLARAEAYHSAGDRQAAESDYRAGIEDMEAPRNGLEPELRIAYFERADRLFERLIELLLEQGRAGDALTVAERKRARALLDQVAAGDAAKPLDAERIRASVPAGAALVEITLLQNSAELWLVSDGRISHRRSSVARRSVEDAVARHLAAIDAGEEAAVKREGRWLYEQLFAPLVSTLPADTPIVIVADGVLYALPFGALVTPDDRYLVDRFPVAKAPSATVFLRNTGMRSYDSLLAVAQPQPGDRQRLPGAASEAEHAARHHPRGRFASGVAIDPARFLQSAGSASCVHFGGHALTDADHPSRSALLFETTAGPAEDLTASEIASTSLASRPLVILAACSTGRGKLRRNEGIQSLAAAFLQAGARGVVATLWDVDDALSAKLFRSFHDELRKGARPADALRSAQRTLLHSPDARDRSPAVWASAVVEGTL